MGNWVTSWAFLEINSRKQIEEMVRNRFFTDRDRIISPSVRTIVQDPGLQCFLIRSFWIDKNYWDVNEALRISTPGIVKVPLWQGPYDIWLKKNSLCTNLIKSFDERGEPLPDDLLGRYLQALSGRIEMDHKPILKIVS